MSRPKYKSTSIYHHAILFQQAYQSDAPNRWYFSLDVTPYTLCSWIYNLRL